MALDAAVAMAVAFGVAVPVPIPALVAVVVAVVAVVAVAGAAAVVGGGGAAAAAVAAAAAATAAGEVVDAVVIVFKPSAARQNSEITSKRTKKQGIRSESRCKSGRCEGGGDLSEGWKANMALLSSTNDQEPCPAWVRKKVGGGLFRPLCLCLTV